MNITGLVPQPKVDDPAPVYDNKTATLMLIDIIEQQQSQLFLGAVYDACELIAIVSLSLAVFKIRRKLKKLDDSHTSRRPGIVPGGPGAFNE